MRSLPLSLSEIVFDFILEVKPSKKHGINLAIKNMKGDKYEI
jgi:hypothetical protein